MFNERTSRRADNIWTSSPALGHWAEHSSAAPAVIIFGPPWPRGGAARVIQNQVVYYRNRGFFTVFLAVPFLRYFIYLAQKELVEELSELGADRVIMASLDENRYTAAKYKASVRHAFHGTVLDWRVAIGEASLLADNDIEFLSRLRPTLFHVNHVYTLRFALNLRRQLFDDGLPLPIILETHDVQSQLLQERGERNPWTGRPDRFERLIKSETKMLQRAKVLVHLSVDDFKFFQTLMPSKPQFLALPTIDDNFCCCVSTACPPAERIDLLLVGESHPPNLAAVKWFFDEVWPLVVDRRYSLKIVGRVGSMAQRELPQLYDAFRTCFVGAVADLTAYYAAARCVIAPMVSGSGTSIKTIEALALGKPFVGTSKAFRGMPMDRLKRMGLQAHDEPQAFANAIEHALENEHEAQALSRAAYDDVFSVEANFAARDEALRVAIKAT